MSRPELVPALPRRGQADHPPTLSDIHWTCAVLKNSGGGREKKLQEHIYHLHHFGFKCLVQWRHVYSSVAPPSPPASSRMLSFIPNWSSVPIEHSLPISWDGAPGSHPLLCVSGAFHYVRSLQCGDSHRLRLRVTGVLHSTSSARGACTLQPVPTLHSLLWLSNSPLYR